MAVRKDETERTHDDVLRALQQDPLSEEDADKLREEGQGFEPPGERSAPKAARQAGGQAPAGRDVPRQSAPGRGIPGDEDAPERRRAREGFTDGEHTQLEEDFGERGLRMKGGIHDMEHKPSILDPEDED